MIFVAEINQRGSAHEMVNKSMLKMISEIFSNENIELLVEKSHYNFISNEESNISKIHNCKVLKGNGSREFFKIFYQLFALFKLFYLVKKRKPRITFMLSIHPFILFFFRILRIFFCRYKIIIVLHGELERIRDNKSLKSSFFGYFLKWGLLWFRDSETFFLVFGEVIKSNLLQELPRLNSNLIISIDHPYPYHYFNKLGKFDTINFVSLGANSIFKNSHYIVELASFIKGNSKRETCFMLAGKIFPGIEYYLNNSVILYSNSYDLIPRSEIDDRARISHFSLFFYTNEHYKLCSSGAFFDAVQYELPIISLKNDFIEFYFKKYGDIGFLYQSLEELKSGVLSLVNNFSIIDYNEKLNNIRSLKKILSIDNICFNLRSQLKQLELCE